MRADEQSVVTVHILPEKKKKMRSLYILKSKDRIDKLHIHTRQAYTMFISSSKWIFKILFMLRFMAH